MVDIHVIAQNPFSLHIREWDVKTIAGTYLGVIEELDDCYMYTDSFGHLTTFESGESFNEVRDWVSESLSSAVRN